MFSGIIQEVGTITALESKNGLLELTISCEKISGIEIGDSIAVDGCCQTVVSKQSSANNKQLFTIQATQETLDKTNFKNYKIGEEINLEPSLRMGDKISGHLVSGHIDAIGIVYEIEDIEENRIVKIEYPKELNKYIANKGSITVNGTSLTVISSKINENFIFTFTLIPFSRDNTNLGLIKKGNPVNLEIDLISRYLVNYLESSNLPVKA